MTRFPALFAAGALAALTPTASAARAAPGREIAFVANAEEGTVSLVDVAARRVMGRIDINPAHRRIERPGAANYAQDTDVSPDGRVLYVSRGYLGDVAAFDVASGRPLWERPLDTPRSDHMTLTPDGRSLFVSALTDNRVYRLAAATGEITGQLATGVYPHDNKISRDGRRLYNSSLGPIGGPAGAGLQEATERPQHPVQFTVADTRTLRVISRTPLEIAFRPSAFSPDERTLYAQRSNEHAVVAFDLRTKRIVRRLDLPIKPGVTPADWDFQAPHHGLSLTPDGRTLCVAGRASDYAALVAAPSLSLIATIPVGDAPGWAEVAEAGRVCLVANTRSNDLSLISVPGRTEIVRLPVGKGPKHITVARVPASVLAAFLAGAATRR